MQLRPQNMSIKVEYQGRRVKVNVT